MIHSSLTGHNHKVSDSGTSIISRFQTKAWTGNSELLVMGFGVML